MRNQNYSLERCIAQLGSAPALGAGGRRFKSYYTDHFINFAGVAQLVERQFVALVVAGSSPVGHPINYEPLAQSVEHLTFNQGVTGSIPVWLTI